MKPARTYASPLRQRQAEATRDRILVAVADLIEEVGPEGLSNRLIAERAGMTEMTVYRHFPSREELLSAAWRRANEQRGVHGGFPSSLDEIVGRMAPLFDSFDQAPAHISATITTPHGRTMRASQDEARREAFLSALAEIDGLDERQRRAAAGVLQLLYSAHAWLSLREHWGMTGREAAEASSWAAKTLIDNLRNNHSTTPQGLPQDRDQH